MKNEINDIKMESREFKTTIMNQINDNTQVIKDRINYLEKMIVIVLDSLNSRKVM